MAHEFACMATGIGSLPLTNPAEAVALALRYLPEAPIWPQLPKRGFQEHMGGQYSEALPGIVRDDARERFSFDSARDLTGELERFSERFLAQDLEYFRLSENLKNSCRIAGVTWKSVVTSVCRAHHSTAKLKNIDRAKS